MFTWPKFGTCFQKINTDYDLSASRFWFSWNSRGKTQELIKRNKLGEYYGVNGITLNSPVPNISPTPAIVRSNPDWLLHKLDGSVATLSGDYSEYFYANIGNQNYLDFSIQWLRTYYNCEFKGHIGLDYNLFSNIISCVEYQDLNSFHDAFETYLSAISTAMRPQYKICINVGSCDLEIFKRMAIHVDCVMFEELFDPYDHKFDRLEKAKWCISQGIGCAIKHEGNFLEGYAALCQIAGPKLYYIWRDADRQIYFNPVMDWESIK